MRETKFLVGENQDTASLGNARERLNATDTGMMLDRPGALVFLGPHRRSPVDAKDGRETLF